MDQDHSPDDVIQWHLPLKLHWFHILLALSDNPRHGSGIVRSILEQTDGKLRLWPATLYGSLEELLNNAWIEELKEPDDHPKGESRKRRYYCISPRGRLVLAAEASRLQTLARVALERVGLGDVST